MKKAAFIFVLAGILEACSPEVERVVNDRFPATYQLPPSLYPIHEIIKPVDMVVLDDYLVIQNEIVPDEDCFYVYSLDSLRFLYSFARYGQGPEEYIAPALVQNGKGNCLSVFEQASFKMRKFELGKESAVMSGEYGIELEDLRPWQEIYYRNDSILVFSTLDNEIKTYNLNSHGMADTYRFHSDLEDRMGGNYNQSFDSFHFSCEQERLFIAFHFNNLIVQGSVDDAGKIAISDTEIRYNHPLNETLFDNRYYYMYVTSTADLNFAQYAGYSFRRLQPFPLNMGKRKFDMLLEVYSSTGRPLAVLDLQHDILRCKVDGVRKRIFTWNTLEDFDHLFVYDYSGLDFDRN